MQSPLLYLTLCSMRNRLRVRLRRLREPRYLIGSVVGIGYFYLFLFRPGTRRGRGGPPSFASMAIGGKTIVQLAAGALLFLAMALAWIWPWSKPALAFSRADVQFLFTAPISRRRLVRYKVLRTQLGALFGSAIMTLIFRPSSFATGWTFFLGLAMVMAILNLHTTGVSLSRATLAVPGAWRSLQRWAPPAIVAVAFAVILGTLGLHRADVAAAAARSGGDLVAEIERLGTTGAAGVVLWPFRAIVSLPLAGSPAAFLAALPFALLVLILNYVWVLRTDVAFEEASAELSEKLARIRKQGIVAPRRPRSTASTPFTLALEGPVETAILWKNLILMGRFLSWTFLVRLAPLLIIFTLVLSGAGRRGETVNLLAGLCVFVAGMTVVLGPQMTRSDLRNDLANLAVLKTWPIRGAALVRGEVLAPALVLSLIAALALVAAGVLSTNAAITTPIADRWTYLLAAVLVAPGVILAQLLVQNGLAVTFPSWVGIGAPRGGIDVTGQRLLMLMANLLALVVVVLPAALVAAVGAAAGYALIGTIPIVLPALLAAGTLLAEAFVASEALGALLERTDVSAIDPLDV